MLQRFSPTPVPVVLMIHALPTLGVFGLLKGGELGDEARLLQLFLQNHTPALDFVVSKPLYIFISHLSCAILVIRKTNIFAPYADSAGCFLLF